MSLPFIKPRSSLKYGATTDPSAYLNSSDLTEGDTLPRPGPERVSVPPAVVGSGSVRKRNGQKSTQSPPPTPSRDADSDSLIVADNPLAKVRISAEASHATIAHLHAALEHQIAVLLENATARNPTLANGTPSVIGITSAVKGEGKSTVALHLAISIARDSFKRVCLIDLSLDDDNMARRLGLRATDGIVQVLEGNCTNLPTLEIDGFDNLAVIPAGGGKPPANPAKIARSPQVVEIVAAAREMFDLIIVDLPPVSSGNALPMASQFDAVILVVNAGVTPKQIVSDALDFIGRQRTLGVVLNRTRASMPRWLHKRFGHTL